MKEADLHRQICNYIKWQHPKVLFNTDMSGIKLTMGQAVKMKQLRSNKGFPDIQILHPAHGKAGLFLEVKKESPYKQNGELKSDEHLKEQEEIINKLIKLDYEAYFVWNYEQAICIIEKYLNDKT
jgi:hypothetical protein